MNVVVGGSKGGVGKSTTCMNIAIGLTLRGKDVVVLDADGQGSSKRWHDNREAAERQPLIPMAQKYGNLVNTVASLTDKYEHVLIDVAGHNSTELITSMVVADIVIAPLQCCDLDTDTLKRLRKQYAEISPSNPKLRVLIYQTFGDTNKQGRISERTEFLEALLPYPEFEVLNSIGCYRKIYKGCIKKGLSVLESSNRKAKAEINELLDEVFYG